MMATCLLLAVTWGAQFHEATVRAGRQSVCELPDDRLIELAVAECVSRGLEVDDATRNAWRRTLEETRRGNYRAVTLARYYLPYRYQEAGGIVTEVRFETLSVAVRILPERAAPELESHESGHVILHDAAVRAGETFAASAFAGETRPGDVADRATEAAGAIGSLGGALSAAFDRMTEHRGTSAVAERLRDTAITRLDAGEEAVRQRLERLRTLRDLDAWARERPR